MTRSSTGTTDKRADQAAEEMATGVRVSATGLQISKSEVRREKAVLEVLDYAGHKKNLHFLFGVSVF